MEHQCFDAVGWAAGRASSLSKTEWWSADMVICLERGADLHMAQLMPLPITVSCFSKIRFGFAFWYRLTRVVPDKGPLNGCVCVCKMEHHNQKTSDTMMSICLRSFFNVLISCSGSRWMPTQQPFTNIFVALTTTQWQLIFRRVASSKSNSMDTMRHCCSFHWDYGPLTVTACNSTPVPARLNTDRKWYLYAFSALTLLVGGQEEHPACKNWLMWCWCGYLSAVRCRLFARGPVDATAFQNPTITCHI